MVLVQLALSMQKNENRPFLISMYKAQVQVYEIYHIKPGTLKLLDEKVGKTLELIGTGENFLNRTLIAWALRSKIDKWDLKRLQCFCKAKDTIMKIKRQPTEWEKIFSNPTSDRGVISKVYKELKKQDTRESNNPIKNGVQT